MDSLNFLTATQAAALIAAGKLKSKALVGASLQRIRSREGEVRAWAAAL